MVTLGKRADGEADLKDGFIWCGHCGGPHPLNESVCPVTKRPLNTTLHAPAAAPGRTMIGSVIDKKYRIRAILGEGGMGTVFEAEHLTLQRSVAVKLVRATVVDQKKAIKRMQHEARIAGAIGHPHICDVYDVGEMPDGKPYLVMQRLLGETLAHAIAHRRRFPVLQGIQIMIEVLSGLHSAHEMNVVHRDLKPQNIFLTSRVGCDPLAKLLDFGLSKMTQAKASEDAADVTSLTEIGARVGTPYYMAPEQLAGSEVDARADLFACGVVLYETLTGRRPFPGPRAEDLANDIRRGPPPAASSLRADLPPELDRVIARALAPDLAARYQKATTFQSDLRALHEMIASRPKRSRPSDSGAIPSLADSRDSSIDVSVDISFTEETDIDSPGDEPTTHRAVQDARKGAAPKVDSDDADHAITVVIPGRARP